MNEQQLSKLGAELARQLKLHVSTDHPDRWDIEGGDKTNLGLARTVIRIIEDALTEAGVQYHDFMMTL